jgi:hypothetical protein
LLTRAETSTLDDSLSLLSLQADVKLEMINITVQLLCSVCNLRVRIPLQKARVRYDTDIS